MKQKEIFLESEGDAWFTRNQKNKENLSADCYGIEPSAQAVAVARTKGINAFQGTADVSDEWVAVSVLRKYQRELSV